LVVFYLWWSFTVPITRGPFPYIMWGAYACKVFPACIVFSVDIFRGKTLPESRTPSLATTYDLQVLDGAKALHMKECSFVYVTLPTWLRRPLSHI